MAILLDINTYSGTTHIVFVFLFPSLLMYLYLCDWQHQLYPITQSEIWASFAFQYSLTPHKYHQVDLSFFLSHHSITFLLYSFFPLGSPHP